MSDKKKESPVILVQKLDQDITEFMDIVHETFNIFDKRFTEIEDRLKFISCDIITEDKFILLEEYVEEHGHANYADIQYLFLFTRPSVSANFVRFFLVDRSDQYRLSYDYRGPGNLKRILIKKEYYPVEQDHPFKPIYDILDKNPNTPPEWFTENGFGKDEADIKLIIDNYKSINI